MRDAWWKMALALLVICMLAPNLASYATALEDAKRVNGYQVNEIALGSDKDTAARQAQRVPPPEIPAEARRPIDPVKRAMTRVEITYLAGGFYVGLPLAALLGGGLVSRETSRDTVWLLLSRPIGRTRMLMIKYGVCAGVLLTVVAIGGALLAVVAALRSYPLSRLDASAFALTGASIWVAALFVLGVALLASVLCRNTIFSLAVTALTTFFVLSYGPVLITILRYFGYKDSAAYALSDRLWLPYYWLYTGSSSAGLFSPIICLVAAALPLFVALWLFRQKAY